MDGATLDCSFWDYFRGGDPSLYRNLDDIPVIGAFGGHGKSYIADIWMADVFGADPMLIIEGEEQDKMCLEAHSSDARCGIRFKEQLCGDATLGFLFSVHADLYLKRRWDRASYHGEKITDNVRKMQETFKREMPHVSGGAVFCSTTSWNNRDENSIEPWIEFDITHMGGTQWQDTSISLSVYSSKLIGSERFLSAVRALHQKFGRPGLTEVNHDLDVPMIRLSR